MSSYVWFLFFLLFYRSRACPQLRACGTYFQTFLQVLAWIENNSSAALRDIAYYQLIKTPLKFGGE